MLKIEFSALDGYPATTERDVVDDIARFQATPLETVLFTLAILRVPRHNSVRQLLPYNVVGLLRPRPLFLVFICMVSIAES